MKSKRVVLWLAVPGLLAAVLLAALLFRRDPRNAAAELDVLGAEPAFRTVPSNALLSDSQREDTCVDDGSDLHQPFLYRMFVVRDRERSVVEELQRHLDETDWSVVSARLPPPWSPCTYAWHIPRVHTRFRHIRSEGRSVRRYGRCGRATRDHHPTLILLVV